MEDWLVIKNGERVRSWLGQNLPRVSYLVLHRRVDRDSEQRLGRLDLARLSGDGLHSASEALVCWLIKLLSRDTGTNRVRLRVYSPGGRDCLRAFSLQILVPPLSLSPAAEGRCAA